MNRERFTRGSQHKTWHESWSLMTLFQCSWLVSFSVKFTLFGHGRCQVGGWYNIFGEMYLYLKRTSSPRRAYDSLNLSVCVFLRARVWRRRRISNSGKVGFLLSVNTQITHIGNCIKVDRFYMNRRLQTCNMAALVLPINEQNVNYFLQTPVGHRSV